MFLFLALLPCVAAQCHEPHLQKRDWHDGDRHCSYRESVVFESFSREFDRLVGPEVDARGRLYVGCGDGVHVLSRDGGLLGKIKLPGKDPAANLAFGKGKHRSTLYVLDETSVTAVELPGTRGARVGRERKFDVGRARYKSS